MGKSFAFQPKRNICIYDCQYMNCHFSWGAEFLRLKNCHFYFHKINIKELLALHVLAFT